jgi:hypothetical protein
MRWNEVNLIQRCHRCLENRIVQIVALVRRGNGEKDFISTKEDHFALSTSACRARAVSGDR